MTEEGLLFAGLKVLDVGTWIAGPVAGTILADFGADVIKVETPGVGDAYRALSNAPISPKADPNYMWLMDARNKRSITLNLHTPEAKEILHRLVRECDVYITNQPAETRRKFGLRYEDLAPLNDRMIYASLTAYGEHGPDGEREGFDGVAWWARTGLMDMVRAKGSMPGASVPGMGDHPTAVAVYASIVTALLRRERTGKGGLVHTSLLANGLWSNGCYAQGALAGADFSTVRNAVAINPNRVQFETSDGRLLSLYMVRTQEEYDRLFIIAGREDLLADERFNNPATRMQNLEPLVDVIRGILRERTAAEWMDLFRANGVPVVLIAQMEDVPGDPQVLANNMAVPPADPSIPVPLVINHPLNIEGMPRVGPKRAPDLGEHTDDVLREMGYGDEAIAAFRERGVV